MYLKQTHKQTYKQTHISHEKLLTSSYSISQELYQELIGLKTRHFQNATGEALLIKHTDVNYLTDAVLSKPYEVVRPELWVSSPGMGRKSFPNLVTIAARSS